MSALFSPIRLGPLNLKNRIVIAPMCQYSAHDGNVSDWHLMHLGSLAQSGAGLLIIEATAVEARGRISPRDVGIWSEDNAAALAPLLASLRRYSAMPIAIQLAHAGRKASSQIPWQGGQLIAAADGGWETVAPSALPHGAQETPPRALTQADMLEVKQAFVVAAVRAQALGIDAIELHAAHGYLLHQFLSPLSNQRSDEYGGSLENRLRFPLEVFAAMKAALPADYPLGIRISASDWVEGAWDVEQSIVFAQALQELACAFIHVSSGGLSPQQKIPLQAGYQVDFAAAIKAACRMPVIAVGLITEASHAEAIIANGQADMVAIARAILYNPHWPWQAAAALGASVDAPPQYWRSQPRDQKALFGTAAMGGR
ncbi:MULTISPECIES: NADH:flavin oxidoreductase/NADH oxidase [unclassified Undibacterium]|uniref:NADH:flavin oxidoreductase/NADH oxidase n=1 Tax=unclassified Undibacterium TaxID=2630295 RepID=UPI002AC8D0AE|nr:MULTISPECIES: NADH:flavin oxidoreductase/NADH oxidase [unclassified Undibacterium]MEB0138569.1 NADH:flavin oxidoreductase/NADH oxidase [Undibacterium sp. CCC2.1]MEB0171367.1 NADH:flavin oxidoreductase/NADH oxidase [Undibacterium sp. CCC1.1]MEB0175333.1 NADH:flavin oxidoreductase/NADH oxidase [Undibacterium sp. CCC3.4]MEB0214563.1 NADH:flavin oxidoreductase/NADH oxidase [Undibacterium sp. 5I2]WPX43062.1 NADH:flavin oxidoreductase/NADH oxidase [Undibacterium sp. CCC3.4]